MSAVWKPNVTVAAVIERDGRFLLVEEETPEGVRLNQPAGHLDPGETPVDGAMRETLEETACAFAPSALLGIYMCALAHARRAQRRLPTCALPSAAPSAMPSPAGRSTRASCARCGSRPTRCAHASPRIAARWCMKCVDDYLAGQRYPLSSCSRAPESRPSDDSNGRARRRRHVGRGRLLGHGASAEAAGLRGRRPVHEELGRR